MTTVRQPDGDLDVTGYEDLAARRPAGVEPAPIFASLTRRLGFDSGRTVPLARLLGRLGEGWLVLHDVPAGDGGAPVEHLLIGPAGVFVVGSDAWRVRSAAVRAGAVLGAALRRAPLTVGALVVGAVAVPVGADDVTVLDAGNLVRYLTSRPPVLGSPEVDVVYTVARRSTTWTD